MTQLITKCSIMGSDLPGHDPLDDFLNPWSLWIQANLITRCFKSGTATPSNKDRFRWAPYWKQHRATMTCSLTLSPCRGDEGHGKDSYMISVSSQWELAGISSTFSMWRPMGLLSVLMQRQCRSTPRLIPDRTHAEDTWLQSATLCAETFTTMQNNYFWVEKKEEKEAKLDSVAFNLWKPKVSPSLMVKKARSMAITVTITLLFIIFVWKNYSLKLKKKKAVCWGLL